MSAAGRLRAVIADDESGARAHLRALLLGAGVQTVGECESGGAALEAVEAMGPDLLCLDVRMPGPDGIEVGRLLRAGVGAGVGPEVVFTTGYADYAAAAFELDAADYLLKPLSAARVGEAVRRVRARLAHRPRAAPAPPVPRIFVPADEHHVAVAPEGIQYVEARDGVSLIHTDAGVRVVRVSLSRLQRLLAPCGFIRTHRAYLVNLYRVRALVPWSRHVHSALLDGGKETHVPVAKSRLAAFRSSVIWMAQAGGGRDGSRASREGGDRLRRQPGAGPGNRRGSGR